jgi:hypothetical protein
VVRSGATLSFYVNGTLASSVAAMDTNPFRNGTNSLRVGGQGRGGISRSFPGRIDEVRIYNRALSAVEVQTDMNTAIGGAPVPSPAPSPLPAPPPAPPAEQPLAVSPRMPGKK